jgi:queuine tRNA-ribosyltransferase
MPPFSVLKTDPNCGARRGVLTTAHGPVQTPAFMPVGTAGSVKGITPNQLESAQVQIILANTYHLMLRPGVEVVQEIGGLHRLMAWNGPILTDSGGYQVFSLSELTRIDDEGVEFANHVDGARIRLNAEKAIDIQNRLGADIIMCFDECTPYPVEPERLKTAVARTIQWAGRSKAAHKGENQLLFGIVQGGVDIDLRCHCADKIVDIGFDGYALGGLSVGEGHELMVKTVSQVTPLLPADHPRYLMGVGMPADLLAAVGQGVDMFDCVLPTRNGRNAFAFTRGGPLRFRNSIHTRSTEPIEADCDCYACRNFTRGAIRHFFNCGEMLGPILLSLHNLRFFQRLMSDIRGHIESGDYAEWSASEIRRWVPAQ